MPIGYYQDPRYVIDLLNLRLETAFTTAADEAMRDPTSGLTTLLPLQMYLRFDPYSQVASLEIEDTQLTNVRVKLSSEIACILGFDATHFRQSGLHYAARIVNLTSTNAIFVYNDIIDSQIVGDALTPLLDVIAVQGRPGDLVCSRFDKPHYKPVLRRHFRYPHFFMRQSR